MQDGGNRPIGHLGQKRGAGEDLFTFLDVFGAGELLQRLPLVGRSGVLVPGGLAARLARRPALLLLELVLKSR